MAVVAYDQQTINSPNPLARFAHRTRVARTISLAKALAPHGAAVVDFGAGTGHFLSALADERPDIRPYAIEPYMAASSDKRLTYVQSFEDLPGQADLVTALEVCEHLQDDELENFLLGARQSLRRSGRAVISVPIMVGGSILLKELNRSLLFRRKPEYSAAELLRATLGQEVGRPANRLPTHKGFDFRWLRDQIAKHFEIERENLSPLPLPWWANSQVFFICKKRPRSA